MQFTINIKPTSKLNDFLGRKYRTRAQIMSVVNEYKARNYFGDREVEVAYNLEKRRRKTKLVYKKKKINGKYQMVATREVVREAHWVGYVYQIPKSLLSLMNKRVVQYDRHFKII